MSKWRKIENSPEITREQFLFMAEFIAKSGDFVWDEFTEKEKWAFVEAFVEPIPLALQSIGFKIIKSDDFAMNH